MKRSVFPVILLLVLGCVSSHPPRSLAEIDHIVDSERESHRRQEPELAKLRTQDSLTEQEFLRLVELNHPAFRSLRRDVEAAVARELQAGLLPNPALFAGLDEAPGSPLRPGDGKWTVGLRYPLVLSGRIGAARLAAERERQMIESLVEARRRALLREARNDLHEFVFHREAARLEEEIRVVTKDFYEIVRERREAKVVLEIDLLKARVESVSQEIESDGAKREIDKAAIRLLAWTGGPDFDLARLRVELPVDYVPRDLKAVEADALSQHPLLKASGGNIELAETLLDAAKREAWPDLGLSLAYGRTADEVSGDREDIVEAGIEIPLPIFHRNQGRIAELEVLQRKAALDHERTRIDFRTRIRTAYATLEQQRVRTTRYRDSILPDAEKSVVEASALYKEKKILGLEMLDAQRTFANARRKHLEARRDLALAIAEYESFLGGNP